MVGRKNRSSRGNKPKGGRSDGFVSFSDKIIPMIQQHRDVFKKRPKGGLDPDEVAAYLKQNVRECQRLKDTPLKIAVQQALHAIEKRERGPKSGKESDSDVSSDDPSDSGSDSSDNEVDPETKFTELQDTNMMNQMLTKAYKGNSGSSQQSPAPQATESKSEEALSGIAVESGAEDKKDKEKDKEKSKEDGDDGFKLNLSYPPPKPPKAPKTPKTPNTFQSSAIDVDMSDSGTKRKRDGLDGMISKRLGDRKEGSSTGFVVPRPSVRYKDLGGVESCLRDIRQLIEYPLLHPEIYERLGAEPVRGILLHGPPGCGKTMLANAIAGELGVPFLSISAPEIVSGMSGESEARLRDLFNEAKKRAPCLVFIDEIDAITPKRESAQREMERRIVAQFLTCLDKLSMKENEYKPVIVIGATNRPDSLDEALRRGNRFDREISLGIPDEDARERILRTMSRKLRLSGDFDFRALARDTPGFVGADLESVTKEAAVLAVNRIFDNLETASLISDDLDNVLATHQPLSQEQLDPLCISMEDFRQAVKKVQPSAKREGFATIPDVTWKDVGALENVRLELELNIVQPIKNPELYRRIGLENPAGFLLWGPPGCGKTLLAKAIAHESGCNFISIKGPELLNKYVGESERSVRQVFQRARSSAPCVIFFDELDALVPRRSTESASQASERVVNTLLTEMDGLEKRGQVFIIGATNRPDIIDRAMLRPGRLNKMLYVELPSPEERIKILQTLSTKFPLHESVNLVDIGKDRRCSRFSGADLSALLREAAMSALKECLAQLVSENQQKVPPPTDTPAPMETDLAPLEPSQPSTSTPVPPSPPVATASVSPAPAAPAYVSPLAALSRSSTQKVSTPVEQPALTPLTLTTLSATSSIPAPSPAPSANPSSSSSSSSTTVQPFREVKTSSEHAVDPKIMKRHFDDAFTRVFPSVSSEDEKRYAQMRNEMEGRNSKAHEPLAKKQTEPKMGPPPSEPKGGPEEPVLN